jgi:HEAT repeat protein
VNSKQRAKRDKLNAEISQINNAAREQDLDALMQRARDPGLDPPLRALALLKLGQLRDVRALDCALEAARSEDLDARLAAAQILGELGDVTASPILIQMLQEDPSAVVKAWAAQSLGTLRSREAIPVLSKTLTASQWQLRSTAAKALVTMNAESARPAMVEAMRRERSLSRRLRLGRLLARLRPE